MAKETKLLVLGEAWGEEEELAQTPFIGKAGWLFNQFLDAAGIPRIECYITNVFNLRPKATDATIGLPNNDILHLCGPKNSLPAIQTGQYIREEFFPELHRLEDELNRLQPNLVLALGNTALWALTGNPQISKNRGTINVSNKVVLKHLEPRKFLATYHPANILRDWSNREITILDFMKAERERHFPEVRRPSRRIAIWPNLSDIASFAREPYDELSIDIETSGDQITCIGFAPTTEFAFVIPFVDPRKPSGSYWSTFEEERQAWAYVRLLCQSPARKVFQNGLYDLHFLWRRYGITVTNCEDDTMLLHHALQPELPKGLGFMGSIYTNEASWKLMNAKSKTIKREG